jgi:hypothetical protein
MQAVGKQLHSAVSDGVGHWKLVLIFATAAWHLRPRDQWIGWSDEQRRHLAQPILFWQRSGREKNQRDPGRPRVSKPVRLKGARTGWANRRFIHWRQQHPNGHHLTATDDQGHFSEDHAGRAIRAVTAKLLPS